MQDIGGFVVAKSKTRLVQQQHAVAVLTNLVADDPALRNHAGRKSWAEDRWLHGIAYLAPRITANRRQVFLLRAPTLFGALLVPILATAGASSPNASFWRWLTVGVSVVVALCTAIDQVVRPAVHWRLARETRGALETEGWAFLQRTGRYSGRNDDECFQMLFEAVEQLWSQYERMYLAQVVQPIEAPAMAESTEHKTANRTAKANH